MPKIKIGVFDSGVGAVPVIDAIRQALPELEIVYKDDRAHLPYGTRSVEDIHRLIQPIFQAFVDEDCRVIVIACNTVTTNLIDELRAEFSVPLVGMEPAVKPAAEATQTGVIAVCATPRTLTSRRYAELKQKYAKGLTVLEPDCREWSLMVEHNQLDSEKIAKTVENLCQQKADQIVLGCTHYHWIENLIDSTAKGRAAIIQPTKPVINQLKLVLEQLA